MRRKNWCRFWSTNKGVVFGVFLLLSCGSILAQGSEYRTFTDKKGQKIEAELLDVRSDGLMKIRRSDGVEFETKVADLSLEDQIFVQKWMKNKPSKTDYSLKVLINRKKDETNTLRRTSSYEYLRERWKFHISIRNLSREPLETPTLRYALLRKEGLEFMKTSDGEFTYDYLSRDVSDNLAATVKETQTESIGYNHELKLESKDLLIHRLIYDYNNEPYREDELIGLILRIENKNGDLIGRYYSENVPSYIQNMTWDELTKLPKSLREIERQNSRDDD